MLGALKVLYAFRLRIDSDETQHLHVVWAWTQHLLPYRDVFDNHSPLFQFLCAPFLALFGEGVHIVSAMRLLVVPLFFATLWATYRVARNLLPREPAHYAAIFTGAFPIFFIKSSEFRPDDLWAPLWLLSILALMARPFRNRHALLSGIALGTCFVTTMKTSALAISLGASAGALLVFDLFARERIEWHRVAARTVLVLLATLVFPSVVIVFFAAHHALPALYYGTIAHNLTPTLFKPQYAARFGVMAPMLAIAVAGGACAWPRAARAQREWIVLLVTHCVVYLALIIFAWPLVEPHDVLPVAPVAIVFFIPLANALASFVRLNRWTVWPRVGFPIIAATEIAILFITYPPLRNEMKDKLGFIANVLRLTNPSDFVMDAKGESVFRRRPFYYVLEGITLRRIELGLLADDIPARLIETTTPIATTLRMPPRACDFIEENYVPVAFRLRVLGKNVGARTNDMPIARNIEIVIPARYTVVAERGRAQATIDGVPLRNSRYLDAGPHEVVITSGDGDIDLIWADAAEKGFSPFSPLASDFPGASD